MAVLERKLCEDMSLRGASGDTYFSYGLRNVVKTVATTTPMCPAYTLEDILNELPRDLIWSNGRLYKLKLVLSEDEHGYFHEIFYKTDATDLPENERTILYRVDEDILFSAYKIFILLSDNDYL